jgi:hypothetical protein
MKVATAIPHKQGDLEYFATFAAKFHFSAGSANKKNFYELIIESLSKLKIESNSTAVRHLTI